MKLVKIVRSFIKFENLKKFHKRLLRDNDIKSAQIKFLSKSVKVVVSQLLQLEKDFIEVPGSLSVTMGGQFAHLATGKLINCYFYTSMAKLPFFFLRGRRKFKGRIKKLSQLQIRTTLRTVF